MTPEERRNRAPLLNYVLAGLVIAAATAPIIRDLWSLQDLIVPGRAMIGRDFLNSWAGGRLAMDGHAADIYSSSYMPMVRELLERPIGAHNFSYPPPLLLFLWPLAFLAYLPALLAWTLATAAAFALAARSYLRRAGLPWWTALLLPASLVNLWAGHHGFVLAALWLAAFAAVPGRPVLAGVLIGLLTLKPHMGVLIPLVLLLRGEWRVVAAAAATAAALVGASLLAFGPAAWANYFDWTASLQASFLQREKSFFLYLMPTPYVGFWLASKTLAVALAGHALVALAALAIVVRAARSAMTWPELGLVTATATFLVLPYAFNYDMAVVCLAAAILLLGRGRRLGWLARGVALLAFAAPVLVIAANYYWIPLVPLALLAFLWLQARSYAPVERPIAAPAAAAAA